MLDSPDLNGVVSNKLQEAQHQAKPAGFEFNIDIAKNGQDLTQSGDKSQQSLLKKLIENSKKQKEMQEKVQSETPLAKWKDQHSSIGAMADQFTGEGGFGDLLSSMTKQLESTLDEYNQAKSNSTTNTSSQTQTSTNNTNTNSSIAQN